MFLEGLKSLINFYECGYWIKGYGLQWNFPGGPMAKNLPYNTGDVGSIPDQETEIPNISAAKPESRTTEAHALEPASPCTAVKDPAGCNEDLASCN